jgi:hypothetical protein
MIEVKEAVRIAKQKAAEMLDQEGSFEEIERGDFKGRDAWSITLGFPPKFAPFSRVAMEYKRFFIDAETGELMAMKLREFASQ